MNEIIVLIVVFLALWGGHWMPWWVIPAIVDKEDEKRRLLRPLAYVYGCTCIFCGFVLWAGLLASYGITEINVWIAVRFLALDIVAAGLGTMAPRGVKLLKEYRALTQDSEDYEQAVQE